MEIKTEKYLVEETLKGNYMEKEKAMALEAVKYLSSKNLTMFQKKVILSLLKVQMSYQSDQPIEKIIKSADYYINNFENLDVIQASKRLFKNDYRKAEGAIIAYLYDTGNTLPVDEYIKNIVSNYSSFDSSRISYDKFGNVSIDEYHEPKPRRPIDEPVIVKEDTEGEKTVGQVKSTIIKMEDRTLSDPCLGAAFDLSFITNIWDKIGMGFGFLKDRIFDFLGTPLTRKEYDKIDKTTNENISEILNTLASTTAKMASKVFDSNDDTKLYKQIRDAIFNINPDLIDSKAVNYMKVACNTIINFDDIKEIIKDSLYKIATVMTSNTSEEVRATIMSKIDIIIDALNFKECSEKKLRDAQVAGADCSMIYNAINMRNGELQTRLKAANINVAAGESTVQNAQNNPMGAYTYHSPFEGYQYNIADYTNLVSKEKNENEFLPSQYAPDIFGSRKETDPNKVASISVYDKVIGNSFKDMECLMNTQEQKEEQDKPWKKIVLGISFNESKINEVSKMNDGNKALDFMVSDLIKQAMTKKLISANEVTLNQGQVNYIFNGQDRNFIERAFDVITDTIKYRVFINQLKTKENEQNKVVEKAKEDIKQQAKKNEETKEEKKCDCRKEGCTCGHEHNKQSDHVSHEELENACNILGINSETLKPFNQIQQEADQFFNQQQQMINNQIQNNAQFRAVPNPQLFVNFFQQPPVMQVPMVTPQQ